MSGPNVLVVIQARLGSTRLPGKVLLPLGGKPVLQWVVERCQRAGYPVVVAVPMESSAILGMEPRPPEVFIAGGPENDVLGRYASVANYFTPTPDLIVRITGDCPCVDPALIQEAVAAVTRGHDYASNTRVRTYPRGLDVEAFTIEQLMRTHRQTKDPYDREHVTPFMQVSANRPYDMRYTDVLAGYTDHRWRWVLDTPQDYDWLSKAFRVLGDPTTQTLAEYSRTNPPPLD